MKTSKPERVWFALVSVVLWTGIYLSGFSNINWLVYLPAASFSFAAITGICPGQIATFKLFGAKIKEASNK